MLTDEGVNKTVSYALAASMLGISRSAVSARNIGMLRIGFVQEMRANPPAWVLDARAAVAAGTATVTTVTGAFPVVRTPRKPRLRLPPVVATVEETASRFGLSVPVLKRWLRDRDGRLKPRQQDLDDLAALTSTELAAMAAKIQATFPEVAAATVAETASRFGLTERAVSAWLREKGKSSPRQSDLDELTAVPADQVEAFVTGFQVISKSGLRLRGWTDAMMRDFLPEADAEYENRYYRSAASILAWFQYRILAIETEPACAAKLAKRSVQVAAGQAVIDDLRAAAAVAAADAAERIRILRETAQERDTRIQREARASEAVDSEIANAVRIFVRSKERVLESATLHLGPTNSGKTYDCLQRLIANGGGIYAGPLRMLAWEAYQQIGAAIGFDNVGIRTGEETINETAAILCCTVESAPDSGDLLVLDEAHWLADRERGTAWTRLLLGDWREVHVTAMAEISGVLEAIMSDAVALTICPHQRLSNLTTAKTVTAKTIPTRSVVVAFSGKAVRGLAREMREAGKKVGLLYGALPPDVRREQVRLLVEGKIDVIVATDVIGHGVNLPVNAVWFAEGQKFDGTKRRALHDWEAGQIAGRAGRGRDNPGSVGVYESKMPGFEVAQTLSVRAVSVATASRPSGLRIERVPFGPSLSALGITNAAHMGRALKLWAELAAADTTLHPMLQARSVKPLIGRWTAIGQLAKTGTSVTAQWPVSAEQVWRLVTVPIDADSVLFPMVVRAAVKPSAHFVRSIASKCPSSLAGADGYVKILRDALTAVNCFGHGFGGLDAETLVAQEAAAVVVINALIASDNDHKSGLRSGEGRCTDCGDPCAPWFVTCQICHFPARGGWDDDDEFDDGFYGNRRW